MSQRIDSLYKLITIPRFYEAVQIALGQKKVRRYLTEGPLKTKPGDRVLDVGCGPASLRPFLGDVSYLGMDMNPAHIEAARAAHGAAGTFICGNAVEDAENAGGPFDLIIMIGLLHHLDDDEAKSLISALAPRLSFEGRLVTFDPVYTARQNPIAKILNDLDSGKNVRSQSGYQNLFCSANGRLVSEVLSGKMNVPYNHCCNILRPAA